jgi:hypothetical protein
MIITKRRAAVAGVLAIALAAVAPTTAAFADTPAGSADKWYTLDGNDNHLLTPGSTLHWGDAPVGSPSKTDANAVFTAPADAETVRMFLSKPGDETNVSAWIATGDGAFKRGTKTVLLPSADPASLINGNSAAAKAAGGTYSIGIAFMKNQNTTLATGGNVIFNRINMVAGTDAYTFDSPTETTTPPPAGSQTGQIDISAAAIAQQDGTLSLVVPAGAKATLGTPTLVNGLSTATGTLGQVTVKDGRFATTPGWDLTSSVAAFTNGTATIDAKQLGVKPKVVSGQGTAAAGNTAGTASDGKFASAANGQVGDTVLDADLTFVAPAKTAAGTYTSKMTLTLVSK